MGQDDPDRPGRGPQRPRLARRRHDRVQDVRRRQEGDRLRRQGPRRRRVRHHGRRRRRRRLGGRPGRGQRRAQGAGQEPQAQGLGRQHVARRRQEPGARRRRQRRRRRRPPLCGRCASLALSPRPLARCALADSYLPLQAGNDNRDACGYSPAAAEGAITVGASTIADERAYFSNHGKCVDIFAPGLNILSIWNSGNRSINTISGTSCVSPPRLPRPRPARA